CALAEHALSAAVTSIMEALKSNDWKTRKAASVALAGIAVDPGSSLAPLRSSCIRFLESCSFDKVKPVRDSIMHAIQCWRALPVTHSSETSEARSSTKGITVSGKNDRRMLVMQHYIAAFPCLSLLTFMFQNASPLLQNYVCTAKLLLLIIVFYVDISENFGKDINVVTSVCDSRWSSFRKNDPVSDLCGNSTFSTQKGAPLFIRKQCTTNMQSHQRMNSNDWHIEISVPKTRSLPPVNSNSMKSDSSIRDLSERRLVNTAELRNINFDYGSVFDKPECSSVYVPDYQSYQMEGENDYEGNDSISPTRNDHSAIEDNGPECLRIQERKSPDSTISDLCSRNMHGCCVHAANGLAAIKQQLIEIETKQSNLLDLLQVICFLDTL
ncbi:hypothetical protein BHE74_00044335, partial [Ensete ventricosum]